MFDAYIGVQSQSVERILESKMLATELASQLQRSPFMALNLGGQGGTTDAGGMRPAYQ